MKRDKFKNQRGEIVLAVILIISVISLGVSTTKVGQYAIDRHHSDQIAQSLKEQSRYLSQQATKLGRSGDEAVKESLRLNEASKDIEEHGLQVFSEKALGESVNMSIGSLIGQAGGVGQAINTVMDIDGILKSNAQAWTSSPLEGDDKKLAEIIQGSKTNMDNFDLAQRKAILDDIARMRGEVKTANDYLDQLIKSQEENEAKWKKWEEERARIRLGAIQKEEIKKEYEAVEQKGTGSGITGYVKNLIQALSKKPTKTPTSTTSSPQDQSEDKTTSAPAPQTQSGGLDNIMLNAFKIYCEFGEKKYGTNANACIQKNMDDYKKAYQQCLTVMTKEKCEEMLSKSAEGYKRAPEFFK